MAQPKKRTQETTDLLERYYPEFAHRIRSLARTEPGGVAVIVPDPTESANCREIVDQRAIVWALTQDHATSPQSAMAYRGGLFVMFALGIWLGQLGLARVPDVPREARPVIRRPMRLPEARPVVRTPMRWPADEGAAPRATD